MTSVLLASSLYCHLLPEVNKINVMKKLLCRDHNDHNVTLLDFIYLHVTNAPPYIHIFYYFIRTFMLITIIQHDCSSDTVNFL